MRLTQTMAATIRRFEQGTDAYGNQVRTGETTETPVRCWVNPSSTNEDRDGREQVEQLFKLFIDGDEDVRHQDQIVVDGLTLEVVGNPFRFRDRRGTVHHLEAIGRIVEG